jgi:hypothetical protein
MKIFVCNDRQFVLNSMKWLLDHCGYNWRSLEITQGIRIKSKLYNRSDNILLLGQPAQYWEEVLILKDKNPIDHDYNRLVLLDIPKDVLFMFKLIWGGEIAKNIN